MKNEDVVHRVSKCVSVIGPMQIVARSRQSQERHVNMHPCRILISICGCAIGSRDRHIGFLRMSSRGGVPVVLPIVRDSSLKLGLVFDGFALPRSTTTSCQKPLKLTPRVNCSSDTEFVSFLGTRTELQGVHDRLSHCQLKLFALPAGGVRILCQDIFLRPNTSKWLQCLKL